jgi:nucleotide-binding universal stress UspA family protein
MAVRSRERYDQTRARPLEQERAMYTMLVAYDGSEHAESAVRHALDMARRVGTARIVLLNVQPPVMSGEVSSLLTTEEVVDQHIAAGNEILAPALRLVQQAGVPCEAKVALGRPADVIVEHARNSACDAIVVGASSHGRVHSLVLGSVASNVAHTAPVPVTVVK